MTSRIDVKSFADQLNERLVQLTAQRDTISQRIQSITTLLSVLDDLKDEFRNLSPEVSVSDNLEIPREAKKYKTKSGRLSPLAEAIMNWISSQEEDSRFSAMQVYTAIKYKQKIKQAASVNNVLRILSEKKLINRYYSPESPTKLNCKRTNYLYGKVPKIVVEHAEEKESANDVILKSLHNLTYGTGPTLF